MDQLLVKNSSGLEVKRFPLSSNSCVVGRRPLCDLVLDSHAVSREHAKFTKRNGSWFVEDLQSRNGVYVNGKRIGYEPVEIRHDDVVLVGDETLVFRSDAVRSAGIKSDVHSQTQGPRSVLLSDSWSPESIRSQFSIDAPSQEGMETRKSVRDYLREIKLLEDRVSVLLDFSRILGKAESIAELAPRFLKGLLQLFPSADTACVCAPTSNDAPIIQWRLLHHACRRPEEDVEFRISSAILNHVAAQRVAVLSDSAVDDLRFVASESMMLSQICSVMAVPVYDLSNNRLLGVIQIDSREFKRSFTQDDLKLLVAVARQISVSWENQHYHDELVKQKMALREMQLATQVQRGFIPQAPPKFETYEFFDYYRPAKFIGGDFFDYIPLPDGKLAAILGDVSGKGIAAALFMAKLSSEARYNLLTGKSFSDAMAKLNRAFCENNEEGRFITFVMIILEPGTGLLRIFNAGHLYPMVSKADGTVVQIGEGFNSFPLGIIPEAEYPEFTYTLAEGEAVAIMSDGFPDAQNSAEEAFGDERVARSLQNPDGLDVTALGSRLVDDLKKFSDSCPQTDDQCLVVFRHVGSAS